MTKGAQSEETVSGLVKLLFPDPNGAVPDEDLEWIVRLALESRRRVKELVGDRDPRAHEHSIELRPFDADRSGAGLGLPVLVACVGGLLERSTRGGTILVGSLNLGGSVEMLPNPVAIAKLAVDKRAATLLMPVAARRALNDLPDALWTKLNIEFYSDPADGVFKALLE